MTVKIIQMHTREGDKQETLTLQDAQKRVETAIHQGWLVAKTYTANGKLETIQISKAEEVQDTQELLLVPPIAGG